MNLIADQDRILQLVENENDSREIPMRDNESEHQEGRKEHTEILDIRKRTRTRQENQTERMLKRRRSELQPGEVEKLFTQEKLFTHVESHASAVSLLESGE